MFVSIKNKLYTDTVHCVSINSSSNPLTLKKCSVERVRVVSTSCVTPVCVQVEAAGFARADQIVMDIVMNKFMPEEKCECVLGHFEGLSLLLYRVPENQLHPPSPLRYDD